MGEGLPPPPPIHVGAVQKQRQQRGRVRGEGVGFEAKGARSSYDSIVSLWTNRFTLRSHNFVTWENVRCFRSSKCPYVVVVVVVLKHLYEGKKQNRP